MSQIFKAFTGLFIVLLMTAACAGLLSLFLQVMAAQNLQADMIFRLEDSSFARPVLEDCFAEAEEADCQLTLQLFLEDGSVKTCRTGTELPEETSEVEKVRLALTFIMQTDFPKISEEHTLTGYAW